MVKWWAQAGHQTSSDPVIVQFQSHQYLHTHFMKRLWCRLFIDWHKGNCLDQTSSTFEFFLNYTNLTFLAFLYKIDITGISKSPKIKLPPLGIELTTPTPPIRIPATLPIQPQRHLVNRRFMNWTWIISGSIEHDFIRVWKLETGMTDKLAEWARRLEF